MTPESRSTLAALLNLVQVGAVVAGVVISVQGFNASRNAELEEERLTMARPFFELRTQQYILLADAAATLALPALHSKPELDDAQRRFYHLYLGPATMVATADVRMAMVTLSDALSRNVGVDAAARSLTEVVRASLLRSWRVTEGMDATQ